MAEKEELKTPADVLRWKYKGGGNTPGSPGFSAYTPGVGQVVGTTRSGKPKYEGSPDEEEALQIVPEPINLMNVEEYIETDVIPTPPAQIAEQEKLERQMEKREERKEGRR